MAANAVQHATCADQFDGTGEVAEERRKEVFGGRGANNEREIQK